MKPARSRNLSTALIVVTASLAFAGCSSSTGSSRGPAAAGEPRQVLKATAPPQTQALTLAKAAAGRA